MKSETHFVQRTPAMFNRSIRRASFPAHSQRGAMLVIALVMLVLITLVSVSTIRVATMDERMAGNARDRDKAFQAAEAAVRVCLSRLQAESYTGTDPTAQTPASAGTDQVWEVAANWLNNSVAKQIDTIDTTTYGIAEKPRCIFEALGTGTGSYRITGRAVGASSQTVVMVQATYSNE